MLASHGISETVVGKILNHQAKGVTAVYVRAGYDNEKKLALDKWGRLLLAIVEPKTQTAPPSCRSRGADRAAIDPRKLTRVLRQVESTGDVQRPRETPGAHLPPRSTTGAVGESGEDRWPHARSWSLNHAAWYAREILAAIGMVRAELTQDNASLVAAAALEVGVTRRRGGGAFPLAQAPRSPQCP